MAAEKKPFSLGCCLLKIFAVCALLALVAGGVVLVSFLRTASWVGAMVESSPATYAPLEIAPGEKEDVDRVMQRIYAGQTDKSIIDETVTANVFNGVVDRIIQGERDKGKTPNIEALRIGFDGDHFHLTTTIKPEDKNRPGAPPQYVNLDATFDLEIDDGKIVDLQAQRVCAGGGEAPFLVRSGLKWSLSGLKQSVNDGSFRSKDGFTFSGFKLLKREGQRLHVILDPAKFDAAKKNSVPAPPPAGTKEVDKSDF